MIVSGSPSASSARPGPSRQRASAGSDIDRGAMPMLVVEGVQPLLVGPVGELDEREEVDRFERERSRPWRRALPAVSGACSTASPMIWTNVAVERSASSVLTRRRLRSASGKRPRRCADGHRRATSCRHGGIGDDDVQPRGEQPCRPSGGTRSAPRHRDVRCHNLNIHSGFEEFDAPTETRPRPQGADPRCGRDRAVGAGLRQRPRGGHRQSGRERVLPRSFTGSTARIACWPRHWRCGSRSSTIATRSSSPGCPPPLTGCGC